MQRRFIALQAKKLTNGHINRREFVMSALAAGIALPSALTIADKALADSPKSGGLMKLGLGFGSTTDSLDPATGENGFIQALVYAYANNLTEVGPNGKLRGELAESYESTDATTWIFNLRKDVTFHNGKTLTADDVMASFNHHRGEESKSAVKSLVDPIISMVSDGPNRVIMTLATADAGFPFIVSDYHLVILPSVDGKVDALAGVGTGGYSIGAFDPGVRASLKRNPSYWKEDAAHVDAVEILSLLDTTARQNAIMNGDVHVIDKVDPKTVSLLSRVPTLDILEVAGTLHYAMPMRIDTPPFDNRDLRLALKYAVKRQELVDKILLGHGEIGNDHPISSSMQFHASNLPQREFDPEKAMEHYKTSGHSGTIKLSTSDAAFAGAVDAALLIAASAKEVGIDIEVVREPSDGYWSNVWNKKPWCTTFWGGRATEDWMYQSAYVKDSKWNETVWRDTPDANRFNELVVAARAELDDDKRREMYAETQRLIRDDGGTIVPMFANHIAAVSKEIGRSETIAGNWQLDGNKSIERWWFS